MEASTVPIRVLPFADIVGSVWLDLTTITVHRIVSPLSLIEESESVEQDTVAVPPSLQVALALVLVLVAESYSRSYFSFDIVLDRLRAIFEVAQLNSGFHTLAIILHALLIT